MLSFTTATDHSESWTQACHVRIYFILFLQKYSTNPKEWQGWNDIQKLKLLMFSEAKLEKEVCYNKPGTSCKARKLNSCNLHPPRCDLPVLLKVEEFANGECTMTEKDYCIVHSVMHTFITHLSKKCDPNTKGQTFLKNKPCSPSVIKAIVSRMFLIYMFYFAKPEAGHVRHITEKLFRPLLTDKIKANPDLINEINEWLRRENIDINCKQQVYVDRLVKMLGSFICRNAPEMETKFQLCYSLDLQKECLFKLITRLLPTDEDHELYQEMIAQMFHPNGGLREKT